MGARGMVAMLVMAGCVAAAVAFMWGVQRLTTRRNASELDSGIAEPARGLGRLRRLMEGSENTWPGPQSEQHGGGHHHGGHGLMGGHHDGGGFGGGGHHG